MTRIEGVERMKLCGLAAVLGWGLAACSSSTPPSPGNTGSCTPNQSTACTCLDGVSQGAKLCAASGQYGACLPCASGTAGTIATAGTSGGAGNSTGTAGAAGAAGGVCTPNQQVSCKCPDGVSQGLTLCGANGQPYGTCLPCNASTAGAGGGGGAGTAGAGGAGAGGAGGTGGTGGTGGAGGAGGSAGTTATPGCPSSLMCTDVGQLLGMPGLKVCVSGFLPPACDSSMQCPTLPGATCGQGYCIKPCT